MSTNFVAKNLPIKTDETLNLTKLSACDSLIVKMRKLSLSQDGDLPESKQ